MSDDEVSLDRVRETMIRLHKTSDYTSKSLRNDIRFIDDGICSPINGAKVIDVVVECDLISLFADIYAKCFHVDWSGKDGKQNVASMDLVAIALLDGTDKSSALCKQTVDKGLPRVILKYLSDPKTQPDQLKEENIKRLHRHILGILHNVVQKCTAARKAYRDASAVDILSKLVSIEEGKPKCITIFILAYITSEDETEKMGAHDDNSIALVIKMLRQVYKVKDGRTVDGFRKDELIEANMIYYFAGLNKLANNDSNKWRIVRMGALPVYTELLTIGSQREQRLACQGLWRLAFKCSDIVKQEPGCVDAPKTTWNGTQAFSNETALKKLSKNGVEEVSKKAKGALWQLHKPDPTSLAKAHDYTDSNSKHIMLSYNWGSQDLMKRIRDDLKKAGYKVWMDLDLMRRRWRWVDVLMEWGDRKSGG
ncbi:hypothetical protein LSAT2_004620, partial [Lamellibrachia satsuma]